ncbi:MAG: RluA family pseudouridine synthase [Sphingobacteriales bacterium]|nr:RluA family pseudouridine synthase [Sphingobacteriales bacterium]
MNFNNEEEISDIELSGQQEGGDELYEHFRYVVDKKQELLRIDKFLFNRLERVSRHRIQVAIKSSAVLVNGNTVKPNYRVKPYDTITIVMPYAQEPNEVLPEDIPLNIMYEDTALVIVNKEAGMVVHPGCGNPRGTLVNALVHRYGVDAERVGEAFRPWLVHRIDKDTTGLMVVARTEEAMNHLARQFFERSAQRRYIALVWGNLEAEQGTIEGNIGRNLRYRKIMDVFPEGEQGKPAVTHYRVLQRFGYVTLVECKLETGRTHQIRVHFSHIGHPLFGDESYGGDKIVKGTVFSKYKHFVEKCLQICPRQALHARTLGIIHPTSGQYIHFESELPADMQALIAQWEHYTQ